MFTPTLIYYGYLNQARDGLSNLQNYRHNLVFFLVKINKDLVFFFVKRQQSDSTLKLNQVDPLCQIQYSKKDSKANPIKMI